MVPSSRVEMRKARTLDVLYGGKVPKKVPNIMNIIAECLEHPKSMYLHIEEIVEDPRIRDIRLHLVRVQMDSELHMRDDVDLHTHRLWVAQSIERIVFGGLMIDGEKLGNDDEEDDKD